MYNFQRYKETSLYVSSETGSDLNFFGYYLPDGNVVSEPISYNDSWSTYSGWYIFLKSPPDESGMSSLILALEANFPKGSLTHTSLAWVSVDKNSNEFSFQKIQFKNNQDNALVTETNFSMEILNAVFLLASESPVVIQQTSEGDLSGISIEYPPATDRPQPIPTKNVCIAFTGNLRGCIRADISRYESSETFSSFPKTGFYSFVSKPETPDTFLGCFYPLFANTEKESNSEVYTGYTMTYDPIDPYNRKRTKFTFAGYAYQIISIDLPPYKQIQEVVGGSFSKESNYLSVFGSTIKLLPLSRTDNPASYVQCELPPGYDYPYYLAPEGDFQIVTDASTPNIGGGLSGTEFFKLNTINEQDTLIMRFEAGQPACVKSFPFVLASPVGPPSNSLQSPFSNNYQTAWATIIRSSEQSVSYVAQPAGASLFAKGDAIAETTGILNPADLAFSFTANKTDFFPMLPYGGLNIKLSPQDMAIDDITALEAVVMSPQRRKIISQQSSTNAHLIKNGILQGDKHYATTPSGILATTTQSEDGSAIQWDQFLLGKNNNDEIAFNSPSEQVITAMQSSDVFLVVSDATSLTGFANSVNIADWGLTVNVGKNQNYGDYRNIMIFKGRKGKLYDPDKIANCLIANPKKWSQAEDFSIPQTEEPKDSSQLVILSNWLQTYFENAYKQTSNYFNKFNSIATDENWTGVLFLRVDITGLPNNLSGIIAGVSNPSAFNAHHLGIEVSPVNLNKDGIPKLDKPSSFFGLIYYVDPGFIDTEPIQPISPGTNNTFNFKLLALKVLFENTAVKGFESYAQLTLNSLFGSLVSKTNNLNNIYKNVLLTGYLQINNGQPVYSLESRNDNAFYLESNIINKLEITGAILSSRSPSDSEQQRSWFGLSGFIDYKILKDANGNSFDLFSFGNTDNEDALRKGLNFSNLGIAMDFAKNNPAQNTLSFVAEEIRFNPSPNVSTPRAGSLYSQLHLGVESLLVGAEEKNPKDFGFLDMIPDMALGGPGTDGWYGLRFKLNMGSPGALAGNIGFNSYLLVSWSPLSQGDQNYKAGIGISLPGASGGGKLLSLQTVLSLSIGQIRLTQVPANGGGKVFMLLFTEIALKFLGFLKFPPSGNTLFYLFGDPKTNDATGSLGWYAMYKSADMKKQTINI